jgi:hypothetical protein
VTKTVDGVCAECWGAKDIDAVVVRSEPRTEPLLDVDWLEVALWAGGVLLLVVLVALGNAAL